MIEVDMAIEIIVLVLLLPLYGFMNHLIGNKELRSKWNIERWMVYACSGIIAAGYSLFHGFDMVTVGICLGGIPLGYAVFRQIGPDIAFFAGHLRNIVPTMRHTEYEALPNWYNWFLRPILKEDVNYIAQYGSREELKKLGIYGGAVRGSVLIILGAILTPLHWISLIISSLGLTFGLIHYIMGVAGPFGTEVGMRKRSELVVGVIIGLTCLTPILINNVFN